MFMEAAKGSAREPALRAPSPARYSRAALDVCIPDRVPVIPSELSDAGGLVSVEGDFIGDRFCGDDFRIHRGEC